MSPGGDLTATSPINFHSFFNKSSAYLDPIFGKPLVLETNPNEFHERDSDDFMGNRECNSSGEGQTLQIKRVGSIAFVLIMF